MTDILEDITIAKLDKIERGLEGVTEGPWVVEARELVRLARIGLAKEPKP